MTNQLQQMKKSIQDVQEVVEREEKQLLPATQQSTLVATVKLKKDGGKDFQGVPHSFKKIMESNPNNGSTEVWREKADFIFCVHHIEIFFVFSLPRPPESTDLEDKINLKRGGTLRGN
ncbi:hypothetical protein QQ045_006147 [Rhodiola kirilowii]